MAADRGLSFVEAKPGEYISGRLAGATNLASGQFAMIDATEPASSSSPVSLDPNKRIGQHIRGSPVTMVLSNGPSTEDEGWGRKGCGLSRLAQDSKRAQEVLADVSSDVAFGAAIDGQLLVLER
ncbi:hypothetical protein LB523_18990 [Mesorhizobium sp. ESP-6-4]|nr:hypothetical protein [Mesorhizobium sp. ESP-6-4]MBZ9661134.1 hypothetical protein [Mesorhizobium sp. ESP-6-4]